ncbi:cytochrome P450 2C16-like isoform X2 [Hyperolius riggenbachi]|uniref:cytochrome P450 2C16-like isoform X2 n=1 Tax=Hyperolius riggenbachi TaxID=752182 RepID=UPI0035A275F6
MVGLEDVTSALVGIATFLVVLSYGKFLWRRAKMPPGPLPLPLLGNFLQLHFGGLLPSLIKMSRKFGPVFTVHFGSNPTVVVTGYEAIKEVFIDYGDAFLDRGSIPFMKRILDSKTMSFTNGYKWKQLRQFCLQTLKDFGMGKKSLEDPILEEIQHLVEHFRRLNEQPYDPSIVLSCASSNILAKILMSTRYDYSDEKWIKILQNTQEAFHIASSIWGQMFNMFPTMMSYLPGTHRKAFTIFDSFKDLLMESIRTHQETLDPASPRDLIDCFLIRIKQEEMNRTADTPFTLSYLVPLLLDMFLAGMSSNAVTQYFGLLILIKYPELQEKLHDEIDRIVGHNREPRAEERSQMPYMNAVIHEIQRFADVFPMGSARATTRDITFRGFFLAKGTNVLPMLTSALKDPTQFKTPEEFNASHFMDENGTFKKQDAFLTFGAGKRSCIAQSMRAASKMSHQLARSSSCLVLRKDKLEEFFLLVNRYCDLNN